MHSEYVSRERGSFHASRKPSPSDRSTKESILPKKLAYSSGRRPYKENTYFRFSEEVLEPIVETYVISNEYNNEELQHSKVKHASSLDLISENGDVSSSEEISNWYERPIRQSTSRNPYALSVEIEMENPMSGAYKYSSRTDPQDWAKKYYQMAHEKSYENSVMSPHIKKSSSEHLPHLKLSNSIQTNSNPSIPIQIFLAKAMKKAIVKPEITYEVSTAVLHTRDKGMEHHKDPVKTPRNSIERPAYTKQHGLGSGAGERMQKEYIPRRSRKGKLSRWQEQCTYKRSLYILFM